jgi:hypothetical protein
MSIFHTVTLAAIFSLASTTFAQPASLVFLVSDGPILYRIANGVKQQYTLSDSIGSMTTVQDGFSFFSGKALAGDALASSSTTVSGRQPIYRIKNAVVGTPSLEQITGFGGETSSFLFADSGPTSAALYGIVVVGDSIRLRQFSNINGDQLGEAATCLTGFTGGLAWRTSEQRFYVTRRANSTDNGEIYSFSIGPCATLRGTFPFPIGNNGLEEFSDTLYVGVKNLASGRLEIGTMSWSGSAWAKLYDVAPTVAGGGTGMTVVPTPDLTIQSIDAEGGVYSTNFDEIPVELVVRNNGTAAAKLYWIDFYASTDSTITTSDTLIGTFSATSQSVIDTGQSRTIQYNGATAPCVDGSGFRYIGAIARAFNEVVTSNNTRVDSSQVLVRLCQADIDRSCSVDGNDYDAFVALFEAGVAEADYDGSGFVDGDDFDAFVLAYENGC